jgi:hypothetical protein
MSVKKSEWMSLRTRSPNSFALSYLIGWSCPIAFGQQAGQLFVFSLRTFSGQELPHTLANLNDCLLRLAGKYQCVIFDFRHRLPRDSFQNRSSGIVTELWMFETCWSEMANSRREAGRSNAHSGCV